MFSDVSGHFQTSRFPSKNEFSIKNYSGTLELTKMPRKKAKTNLELIRKKFFFASKRPRTQVQYPPKIKIRKKKKFEKKKKSKKF